jgi:hypothetical protein
MSFGRKHAMSLALRSEAVARGVGVLVVCPSAVETPNLDKGAVGGFIGRDDFLQGQGVKTATIPTGWRGTRCGPSRRTRRCW